MFLCYLYQYTILYYSRWCVEWYVHNITVLKKTLNCTTSKLHSLRCFANSIFITDSCVLCNSNTIHHLIHQSRGKEWWCILCHRFMYTFLPVRAWALYLFISFSRCCCKALWAYFWCVIVSAAAHNKLTSEGAEWAHIRSKEATSPSTSQKVGQSGTG